MIPQFPNFKNLELSDRNEIDQYNSKYEPYSDFNFLISWSWSREWDPQISYLNKNLVYRWFSKEEQQPIYSFLGTNFVTETCETLFKHMENRGEVKGRLSYIPEISLTGFDFTNHYIEVDITASDYIFNLEEMHSFAGNKYSQKRGRFNHFKLHFPDISLKILDLNNEAIQKEIFGLNQLWKATKSFDVETVEGDTQAITKLISVKPSDLFCVGIYDNKLIGYAIYSFPSPRFAINHFIKADATYKGIYEFIMHESAGFLRGLGYKYLNHLEDLGLEGLRRAKMTYRPEYFLRKYHIKKL